ncbi:hypothetical protein FQZ97_939520 [compost metagenome]
MGQHHKEKGFAQKFVHFTQPVVTGEHAPFVEGRIAAQGERHHQHEQGHHRQRHEQVLPLAPVDAGEGWGRAQRPEPRRRTAQLAPHQAQARLARAEKAIDHTKAQQTRHGIAERDVQHAPALAIGRQVGTEKTQGEQPVKHARGRIGDTASGGWSRLGRASGSRGRHGGGGLHGGSPGFSLSRTSAGPGSRRRASGCCRHRNRRGRLRCGRRRSWPRS